MHDLYCPQANAVCNVLIRVRAQDRGLAPDLARISTDAASYASYDMWDCETSCACAHQPLLELQIVCQTDGQLWTQIHEYNFT